MSRRTAQASIQKVYAGIMTTAASTETSATDMDGIIEMNPEEVAVLLDEEAQRLLGMTGAEFERRFRAGEFWDQAECREVRRVEQYLPSDVITSR